MPKKITRANIKAAAEAGIKQHGGVDQAIVAFAEAMALATQAKDDHAAKTYGCLIIYCQKR